MATNWTVLTGADIRKVVSAGTQSRANENTADTVVEGDAFNAALANRRDYLVAQAVKTIRGAIQKAGRYPYSVTASSVPPEAEYHTLMLAAWRMVSAQPGTHEAGLQWAVLTEAGSPFRGLYAEACEYVKKLERGESFTMPTDPVGEDWENEVDDDNPAISGIRWADSLSSDEEYAAGVTDVGALVDSRTQNMNTN